LLQGTQIKRLVLFESNPQLSHFIRITLHQIDVKFGGSLQAQVFVANLDLIRYLAPDNLKFCVSTCTTSKIIASLNPQLIQILAIRTDIAVGIAAAFSRSRRRQSIASGTFETILSFDIFLLPKVASLPMHFDAKGKVVG
jgi:hypothetical protein